MLKQLAYFTERQSEYESYLRSRLNGIPASERDSDDNLVEWLLSNAQIPDDLLHVGINNQGKFAKEQTRSSEEPYDKADKYFKGKLEEGTNGVDKFTRSRLKRDDDGRGVGFHQCYWNRVSCFGLTVSESQEKLSVVRDIIFYIKALKGYYGIIKLVMVEYRNMYL